MCQPLNFTRQLSKQGRSLRDSSLSIRTCKLHQRGFKLVVQIEEVFEYFRPRADRAERTWPEERRVVRRPARPAVQLTVKTRVDGARLVASGTRTAWHYFRYAEEETSDAAQSTCRLRTLAVANVARYSLVVVLEQFLKQRSSRCWFNSWHCGCGCGCGSSRC